MLLRHTGERSTATIVSHREEIRRMRLLRDLVAIVTIVSGAGSAAALTPPIPPLSGPYRVQPGGVVLACGGIIGECRGLTLEGTLHFADTFDEVRIAQADLRLRSDEGAWAFPGSGDLPLVGLSGPVLNDGSTIRVELEADGQHGQRVALELIGVGVVSGLVGNIQLALRGTYDEGCCDRYVYEFGNVRLEPDLYEGLALGLQGEPRFVVDVVWSPGDGTDTPATPARLGANLGYFWFFSADNPEIFVKIVSACETQFARVWFFASGLTHLAVRIQVTDRWTGLTKTYINPGGFAFFPIQDTGGFPCQPF
jgi:hypothetical protein